MNTFHGRLKDEGDIAFHFGFEGCSGFVDMMNRLDGKRILFASLEEDNSFFMLLQNKDATGPDGLFAVIPMEDNPTPDDFKLMSAGVGGTVVLAGSPDPPVGFREFVAQWLPTLF